jgi:hypothetical protein
MPSATEKRREEFAERVARSLEAGVIPWQRKDLPDMPIQSAVSGREYGGLNALYLMEKCAEKGYSDPRFITASEANKNGLYVRKGELMLKNAGIEIKPGSDVKEYRDAIKKLTVKNAEETSLTQYVHTPELVALRYSIASTMAMRGFYLSQHDSHNYRLPCYNNTLF